MATLLKVLNNLADIKSAGGVALRVRTQEGHDSPELDAQLAAMIAYLKHSPDPRCLLCENSLGFAAPALMGWNQLPGGKAIFAVCADCGAGPEAEQQICTKIGFRPVAHAGSA